MSPMVVWKKIGFAHMRRKIIVCRYEFDQIITTKNVCVKQNTGQHLFILSTRFYDFSDAK